MTESKRKTWTIILQVKDTNIQSEPKQIKYKITKANSVL